MASVRFSTDEYRMAHGKSPRGQGSWAFCPSRYYEAADYLEHTVWFSGTLAEAKAQAREYFATKGGPVDTVHVVVCS